ADRKYKVRTDRAGDHGSSLGRNRRVQSEQSISRRNVKLPSDPNQREPLPHQEAIAKLGVANGSGRTARVVEERDQRLSAAVGDLNQGGSIASIRLFRSEDVQIGGKLYLATLTARSFVKVYDNPVVGILWIDFEVDFAHDPLVRAGQTEGLSPRDILLRLHLDSRNSSLDRTRGQQSKKDCR